ncbi:MAG: CPBP family intramembrane glutamic endopeptidase [Polyangiaceae bacterium]
MSGKYTRAALFGLAFVGWLSSFIALARLGTWTPFALVGVAMAVLLVGLGAVPIGLLKPTPSNVIAGLGSGLLMVLFTHLAYGWLASSVPGVQQATRALLALLRVGDFSVTARTGLIVIIASCEEVLFRGALVPAAAPSLSRLHTIPGSAFVRVVLLAALYALTTVPLGSPLLTTCAFLCGTAWGLLRLTTGGLVPCVICHVIWDLGVLILWPL